MLAVEFFFKNRGFFSFAKGFPSFYFSSNLLQLWQPGRKFLASVSKHHFQSEKHENFKNFFLKCCSRCFLQVECSFDNPAKNFPMEIQVCFVKVQICWKNNSSEYFFLKFFPLYTWITVLTPLPIFSRNHQGSHSKSRKKHKKYKIHLTSFSQSIDMEKL